MHRFFLFMFLLTSALHASWNDEFDEATQNMRNCLPGLYTREYQEMLDFFQKARDELLQDALLETAMFQSLAYDKILSLKPLEDLVVKKRVANGIQEVFVWEISLLMKSYPCIVPAFPIEIGEKRVVIQKIEPFVFGQKKTKIPIKSMLEKVSVKTYWESHLQAYLLGLSDLVGRNIGINGMGQIRFFDTERCFRYSNKAKRSGTFFSTGFSSHSLDWPQYEKSLDSKSLAYVQKFIKGLDGIEERIQTYLLFRPFLFDMEGFLERLDKVRSFPLEKGKTFRDFYAFLYPKVISGLDDLCEIISPILERKVGHGSVLMLSAEWMDKHEVSSKQKHAIQKWINQHVD